MKRMSSTLVKGFICEECVEAIKRIVKPDEEFPFYDQVEFVDNFCYLGDRLNTSGGNEAVVTARTRVGWEKYREYGSCFMEESFC